jgi:hypothetical protein
MPEQNGQLLCTFSTLKGYQEEIAALTKVYTISGDRIYVLVNLERADDIFLTFNGNKIGEEYYPRTISVHRKKDYNVLYSINALNELVRLDNSGSFSSQVNINWEKYRNSLITTKDGKLKITPTKLVKISRL